MVAHTRQLHNLLQLHLPLQPPRCRKVQPTRLPAYPLASPVCPAGDPADLPSVQVCLQQRPRPPCTPLGCFDGARGRTQPSFIKGQLSHPPLPLQEFGQALADAADAIGIPLCYSVAVISEDGSQVYQEQQFHTGGGGGGAAATPSPSTTTAPTPAPEAPTALTPANTTAPGGSLVLPTVGTPPLNSTTPANATQPLNTTLPADSPAALRDRLIGGLAPGATLPLNASGPSVEVLPANTTTLPANGTLPATQGAAGTSLIVAVPDVPCQPHVCCHWARLRLPAASSCPLLLLLSAPGRSQPLPPLQLRKRVLACSPSSAMVTAAVPPASAGTPRQATTLPLQPPMVGGGGRVAGMAAAQQGLGFIVG